MAWALTDREKVGHLLRRFGFGAGVPEMEVYGGMKPEEVMGRLLDFDGAEDLGDPMRFAFLKDEEAQPGGYRFRLFWLLQMVTTEHPLREKLALFWHDHFAVNEEDVEHGLSMLDYMQKLRTKPGGRYREILERMTLSTAVMRQLNVEMFSKARPNENFARELLELYTLGEGNYSEADIQEVARAMTGWAYMDVYWRLGQTNDERLMRMREDDTPGIFYFFAPDAHIEGKKRVLGREVESFEDVLDLLAVHPQTARYLCGKLWEFFAYPDPEKEVVERLAKRFVDSGGEIKAVLREMSQTSEFWSERCYRKLVKNPVDYAMAICRAQNAGPALRARWSDGEFTEPVAEKIVEQTGALAYRLNVTGMDLFLPSTVAGWDWHDAWISTNTLMRRREFTGILTYYPVDKEDGTKQWLPDVCQQYVTDQLLKRNPQDSDALAHAFLALYDCPLTIEKHAVLKEHFDKHGGVEHLRHNPAGFAWPCTLALQLLGSTPEFHLS